VNNIWLLFVSQKIDKVIINNFYRSSRESYGDQAIGYVCLKRDKSFGTCIIRCKVCPEHRVRNKGYSVTLTIHEKEERVIDVQCHDCAASSGKCTNKEFTI